MQIAKTFDSESVKKIAEGIAVYALGSAALGLIQYVGLIHFQQPLVVEGMTLLIPSITKVIKEWMAGVTPIGS